MKRLIVYAVIAFLGWNYYQKNITEPQTVVSMESSVLRVPATTIVKPGQSFSCDGRQHCSQMRSRAEAEYFLKNCPDTKMDGDRDGIPCENDSRF